MDFESKKWLTDDTTSLIRGQFAKVQLHHSLFDDIGLEIDTSQSRSGTSRSLKTHLWNIEPVYFRWLKIKEIKNGKYQKSFVLDGWKSRQITWYSTKKEFHFRRLKIIRINYLMKTSTVQSVGGVHGASEVNIHVVEQVEMIANAEFDTGTVQQILKCDSKSIFRILMGKPIVINRIKIDLIINLVKIYANDVKLDRKSEQFRTNMTKISIRSKWGILALIGSENFE